MKILPLRLYRAPVRIGIIPQDPLDVLVSNATPAHVRLLLARLDVAAVELRARRQLVAAG